MPFPEHISDSRRVVGSWSLKGRCRFDGFAYIRLRVGAIRSLNSLEVSITSFLPG